MIDDAVDKEAVLGATSELLQRVPGRRKITNPLVGLGSMLLGRAVRTETKSLGRQPTQSDRKSYIPRNMLLSLFQSEHEEHLASTDPSRITTAPEPRPMASRSVEPFSQGHGIDVGFVVGFLKALPGHLLGRVLFRLPSGEPREYPLADHARIVVVGDWGTGEGLAIDVAGQMRAAIDEAGERQVHVVHLGDVYYAGTRVEARTRFLDHWPVTEADRHTSWCLNGNHDMYSAGEGLIEVILEDPRFADQRTGRGAVTTEFVLANRHWSLIGVDTSWKFRLRDPQGGVGHLSRRQLRWLTRHVQTDSDRRTVLFSHHQPFSYDDEGIAPLGNLLRRTKSLRAAGRLTAWFWGHEHKLITYGAHAEIGHATCMGHGAILEAPAEHPRPGEFNATFTDSEGVEWRVPGFAVVDLDGPTMRVRYLDRTGNTCCPDHLVPEPSGHVP